MSTSEKSIHSMREAVEALKSSGEINTEVDGWRTSLPMFPQTELEEGAELFWVLETNHGTIKIQLMPDVAPNHVRNTMYLTELGFYDELSFHRVITGFMAQGGCPEGTGMGGPGYRFAGEFSPNARHDRRGVLSMANAGPNTDGSQFFLTFTATPHLNNNHTVYGVVVAGDPTLEALESRGSGQAATSEPLVLVKASIE